MRDIKSFEREKKKDGVRGFSTKEKKRINRGKWFGNMASTTFPKFIKNQSTSTPYVLKLCLFKWILYHCAIDIPHSIIASTVIQFMYRLWKMCQEQIWVNIYAFSFPKFSKNSKRKNFVVNKICFTPRYIFRVVKTCKSISFEILPAGS